MLLLVCHQCRACIHVQSHQALYYWLTNFKFWYWYPVNLKWTVPKIEVKKFCSLMVKALKSMIYCLLAWLIIIIKNCINVIKALDNFEIQVPILLTLFFYSSLKILIAGIFCDCRLTKKQMAWKIGVFLYLQMFANK